MTIQEAYQQIVSKLQQVYDEREAANISNMVIEHFSGHKKIDRIVNKHLQLTYDQLDNISTATIELLTHKPIQYVLHEAWFAGLPFYVNEHVLIPRPETEELVEWIISDAKTIESRSSETDSSFTLIDIGTGSGCIPVSLKKKLPAYNITAIDVSKDALDVAMTNAAKFDTPINFQQVNFLVTNSWSQLGKYDVIVSNPPYIKHSEAATMDKNVLAFEPHVALFVPDNNALVFYEAIVAFALHHLQHNGTVYLEINEALGGEVTALFTAKGFSASIKKDLQGKDRMVKAIFDNRSSDDQLWK
jgi:release factor glutamine methyltransferase